MKLPEQNIDWAYKILFGYIPKESYLKKVGDILTEVIAELGCADCDKRASVHCEACDDNLCTDCAIENFPGTISKPPTFLCKTCSQELS